MEKEFEQNVRLIMFLALPAIILFCSIIWLLYDWIGMTKTIEYFVYCVQNVTPNCCNKVMSNFNLPCYNIFTHESGALS